MKEAIDAIKKRVMKSADPATGWRVYDPSENDFSEFMTDMRTVSLLGGLRGIHAINISPKVKKEKDEEHSLGGEKQKQPVNVSVGKGGGKKYALGEEEQKQLLDYMDNPSPDVTLVIATTGADFRQKFWKTLKTKAKKSVAFATNETSDKGYIAEKMRSTGLEFSDSARTWMMERFVNGTRQLYTELQKLTVYMGKSRNVTLKNLEECLNVPGTESVFMLADAIGNGWANKSLQALSSLKNRGEETFRVLPMIARHIRQLLVLKSFENEALPRAEKAKRCGIHPFFFEKNNYEGQAAKFTMEKLKTILCRLAVTDLILKKTKMNRWSILEKEIISLIDETDPQQAGLTGVGNP